MPMLPNSLKFTQAAVDSPMRNATARLASPIKAKKPVHAQLRRFQTASGKVSCAPSSPRIRFLPSSRPMMKAEDSAQ